MCDSADMSYKAACNPPSLGAAWDPEWTMCNTCDILKGESGCQGQGADRDADDTFCEQCGCASVYGRRYGVCSHHSPMTGESQICGLVGDVYVCNAPSNEKQCICVPSEAHRAKYHEIFDSSAASGDSDAIFWYKTFAAWTTLGAPAAVSPPPALGGGGGEEEEGFR